MSSYSSAAAADVIIIGGGPAGLSAALVLGRCGRRVVLIDAGRGRNRLSHGINGFLTRDGIAPGELRAIGRREAKSYGALIVSTMAVDARRLSRGGFAVTLKNGRRLRSRTLLLATGVADVIPDIPGLGPLYGRSVHHCPYCDAHQYRKKTIAALGDPKSAVGLGIALRTWTDRVVACTNGQSLSRGLRREATAQGIAWRQEPVLRLQGKSGRLRRVVFARGDPLACDALFFNTGQYQRSDLPRRLGCSFQENGGVRTDDRQATGVPGLYLAGDADRDVQFAIVAAAEGAVAAVAINHGLQIEEASLRRQRPSSPLDTRR